MKCHGHCLCWVQQEPTCSELNSCLFKQMRQCRTQQQDHVRGLTWLQQIPFSRQPHCDSGLWSQNSHSRGHESQCIHGVCILSRQSADSDPSHKVRPVTHFPNIRVCTTKEELAGATRMASPSTLSPQLRPSHMPTLSHPPGHIPCVRVSARLEVSF